MTTIINGYADWTLNGQHKNFEGKPVTNSIFYCMNNEDLRDNDNALLKDKDLLEELKMALVFASPCIESYEKVGEIDDKIEESEKYKAHSGMMEKKSEDNRELLQQQIDNLTGFLCYLFFQ